MVSEFTTLEAFSVRLSNTNPLSCMVLIISSGYGFNNCPIQYAITWHSMGWYSQYWELPFSMIEGRSRQHFGTDTTNHHPFPQEMVFPFSSMSNYVSSIQTSMNNSHKKEHKILLRHHSKIEMFLNAWH